MFDSRSWECVWESNDRESAVAAGFGDCPCIVASFLLPFFFRVFPYLRFPSLSHSLSSSHARRGFSACLAGEFITPIFPALSKLSFSRVHRRASISSSDFFFAFCLFGRDDCAGGILLLNVMYNTVYMIYILQSVYGVICILYTTQIYLYVLVEMNDHRSEVLAGTQVTLAIINYSV